MELAGKYGNEDESTVAFEDANSGFVLANPLDFAKYFADLSSATVNESVDGNESDGVLIRLKALPTKKLSFRLARDISREFRIDEPTTFILESERIVDTLQKNTCPAEKPFKLASDEFRPFVERDDFSLKRDADMDLWTKTEPRPFVLAKDQASAFGTGNRKGASENFKLASEDDASRLLRIYRT